jgi:hypothetical protein
MGIKMPKATLADLQNPAWWAKVLFHAKIEPSDGTITDDAFAPRAARSVIGRSSATTGAPSDIVAGADGRVLVRRSGSLIFDALAESDIPSGIARDSEVTTATNSAQTAAEATAAAALTAHEGAANPHPDYTTSAELSAALAPYATTAALTAVSDKLPTVVGNFADDATAAVGGVAVGSMYHTAGAVKIRLA